MLVLFCAEPIDGGVESLTGDWEPAVARLASVATSVSIFVVLSSVRNLVVDMKHLVESKTYLCFILVITFESTCWIITAR